MVAILLRYILFLLFNRVTYIPVNKFVLKFFFEVTISL